MRSLISHAESLESRRLLSNTALLDPSFGDGGLSLASFPDVDSAIGTKAISLVGDGKVLALSQLNGDGNSGIGIARFKADGTLDTAFAKNGYVLRMYDATMLAEDMTVDASGRILIAGQFLSREVGAQDEFFVMRLNPDGSIDRSFAQRGIAITDFSDLGFAALGKRVAVAANGHIAVAGILKLDINSTTDSRIAVAEFTDTGALTGFSTDGRAITDTPGNLPSIEVTGAEFQSDNKLVVAGTTREDFLLVRYNLNGTLDKSFSSDGLAGADFAHGSSDFAHAMEIQGDGKILIGGSTGAQGSPLAMARFLANGSIDTTFGVGGTVTALPTANVTHRIQAIGLMDNNQIVVAGTANQDSFVGLFNADGTVDTTFGEDGFASAGFGNSGRGDLLVQSDGKVLVAGTDIDASKPLVARFGRDDISLTPGGQLIVTGTSVRDDISIITSGADVQATFNGVSQTFTSPVTSINARLLGGSDRFSSTLAIVTTVDGGTGSDSITTGDADDVLLGAAGNDTLNGGGGRDIVSSAAGRDLVLGGIGDDQLNGGADPDVILGDAGSDSIIDYGGDNLAGGDGNDTFQMGGGSVTIHGDAGNDIIIAADGFNAIFGDAGDDRIFGSAGIDNLQGGEGNDSLTGGDGDDQLGGNAGNDTLIGGIGADFLSGNGGKDTLAGEGGKDRLYGGDGNDAIDGASGDDRIFGQEGVDKLFGGSGNDKLDGGSGIDQFFGNADDDDIFSRDGNIEALDGGSGEDHGIIDVDDVLISVETNDQLFT